MARPLLAPREAGVVTGVVPGLRVATGMGVCGVSAPVLGSSRTPDAPPISAGASVCPGAAVCPGVTCSHHIGLRIAGPTAGLIAYAGFGPCLPTLQRGSQLLPGACWLARVPRFSRSVYLSPQNLMILCDRLISLRYTDPMYPMGIQSRMQNAFSGQLVLMQMLQKPN